MLNEQFFTGAVDALGPDEHLEQTLPAWADMMDAYPALSTSMAVKGWRTRGTILRGGYAEPTSRGMGGRIARMREGALDMAESRGPIGRAGLRQFGTPQHLRGGWVREGVSQANYGRPRNWGRFADSRYLHRDTRLMDKAYNPYYMAQMGNAAGRFVMGSKSGGNALSRSALAQRMGISSDTDLFSRGFVGRVSAGAKMQNMSSMQWARHKGQAVNFLSDSGATFGRGADGRFVSRAAGVEGLSARQAGTLAMVSGSGSISNYIGGSLARLSDSDALGHISRALPKSINEINAAGQTVRRTNMARRAAESGARHMDDLMTGIGYASGEKATIARTIGHTTRTAGKASGLAARAGAVAKGLGVTGGLAVRGALRFAGPIGIAMLAYDVTRLTTKGVGHIMKTSLEMKRSFEGGARVGIMQQSFRDTEATMTSRSRGVQAIQNSRLNARSILGNEAGALAAHFG